VGEHGGTTPVNTSEGQRRSAKCSRYHTHFQTISACQNALKLTYSKQEFPKFSGVRSPDSLLSGDGQRKGGNGKRRKGRGWGGEGKGGGIVPPEKNRHDTTVGILGYAGGANYSRRRTDPGTLSAGATGVVADLEIIRPDEVRRARSVVENTAAAADVGFVAVATPARLVVTVGHADTAAHAAASGAPARTLAAVVMMMVVAVDVVRTVGRVATSVSRRR